MALEFKMDVEYYFQHSVYRNTSFSKWSFFCFCDIFIEINLYQKLNMVARFQEGGFHVDAMSTTIFGIHLNFQRHFEFLKKV
jgi:hypothetical protein